MNRFLAALRFLTILPIPGERGHSESDLASSLVYFPVVGLLIGLTAAGFSLLFGFLFPPMVTAVLVVLVLLAVSGGLHMDGLCDSVDGFFSSRPRERMLEIMRDSRVGAMGVMAIVLVLGLKVTALGSLDENNLPRTVLLMPVVGRCSLLILMAVLPYARPEGGRGTLFYTRSAGLAAVWAVWAVLLVLLTGWLAAATAGIVAGMVALIFVLIFAAYCRGKIGGATGDTLGAGCELAETAVALVLAAKPIIAFMEEF
jgi:adenosylcobinamide-GDP ribazoletransferase